MRKKIIKKFWDMEIIGNRRKKLFFFIFFSGVREDYLNKGETKTTILPKMRAVLVDWLIQVIQVFKNLNFQNICKYII